MMQPDAEAVLVTGVYGTGKTTAIEEMAEMLEAADVRYAAIDLDWLAWANLDDHGPEAVRLLLANLAAVVTNLRLAGMTRFLLAGTIHVQAQVEAIAAAADMPVRVIRLTAPIDVIAARLGPHPTRGRQADLAKAGRDVAAATGTDVGDLVVASDRAVHEVAAEILDWLGWLPSR